MMKSVLKKLYVWIEDSFDKISEAILRFFINSVVFFIVLVVVSVWFLLVLLGPEDMISKIRDCFIAVSFLTFFVIQRVLNKYNAAMNIKLSELIRAHENASNELISVEKKSHQELEDLAKDLRDSQEES
jgi:low affinity Fe/Cu permease